MKTALLICLLFLGAGTLKGQTIAVDITVECDECKFLSGGPEGVSVIRNRLSWTISLDPGKSVSVMTMPESVLKPVDMTVTATVKGKDFSFTTFAKGKDFAVLPIINSYIPDN